MIIKVRSFSSFTDMENPSMALLSSSSPKPAFSQSFSTNSFRPSRLSSSLPLLFAPPSPRTSKRVSFSVRALKGGVGADVFASLSSGKGQQTISSVGSPNLAVPPPPSSSSVGSPLFWIGVGVGFSAIFSFVAGRLKQFAVQQAFKTMMNQMNEQQRQYGNAESPPGSPFSPGSPFPPGSSFPPGSPFSFPPPQASGPNAPSAPTSAPSAASRPTVTVDVSATKVQAPSTNGVKYETKESVKHETEENKEEKKFAFVDVSPDETMQKSPFENFEDVKETSSSEDAQFLREALKGNQNGAAFKEVEVDSQAGQPIGKRNPFLTVEALEKMMEDPTVQKMVYPHLPPEMRNPASFKWMLQNPQTRKQLEDMLDSMSGNPEWDNRMMETLKNFDFNSPEVKDQFDQLGLTPEEVINKVMANPDIAMAFQNPKIQAAIMDCSQNPMSIMKYQNDQEVMDVFNKISKLFPGVTG